MSGLDQNRYTYQYFLSTIPNITVNLADDYMCILMTIYMMDINVASAL